MRLVSVMWIRDGVLVNRMHVNPVAFAVSYLVFTPPQQHCFSLEALINFGFEKSGLSCAEKMKFFNSECGGTLEDIEAAARFYNVLATKSAKSCTYFKGAVQVLQELHHLRFRNYITSAVEQEVLDSWAGSAQGQSIKPYLTEILGKRPGFLKGADHFEYVANNNKNGIIYYVADAKSEIEVAKNFSERYNIVPIGFGYATQRQQVLIALELVQAALSTLADNVPYPSTELFLNPEFIRLPRALDIQQTLLSAGARFVITGGADEVMGCLRTFFEDRVS
jgi:hypothetical protein